MRPLPQAQMPHSCFVFLPSKLSQLIPGECIIQRQLGPATSFSSAVSPSEFILLFGRNRGMRRRGRIAAPAEPLPKVRERRQVKQEPSPCHLCTRRRLRESPSSLMNRLYIYGKQIMELHQDAALEGTECSFSIESVTTQFRPRIFAA